MVFQNSRGNPSKDMREALTDLHLLTDCCDTQKTTTIVFHTIYKAIRGLALLRSFSEYPSHMQEKLCKVAWYMT